MIHDHMASGDPAQALRDEFDSAFSLPSVTTGESLEDLLAIRVGQAPYAIRLSDITGIYVDTLITPLPGTAPELLGLAGFRGVITAIYDLRVLLGAESRGHCRWLVLASANSAVGFAFDQFESHLRVFRDAFATENGQELAHLGAPEAVDEAQTVRTIVRMQALLEAIKLAQHPL
jgi:purine-binding chemotaxis protein CheW